MSKDSLVIRLNNHLLKTVGKKPTRIEMMAVDREIRPIFAKIYAHPDKMTQFLKKGYDSKLSKLWIKVVADESFAEELRLFLKFTKVKPEDKIASIASGLAVYESFLASEYVPRGRVVCIEASTQMNKLANTLVKKIKQKNIKIITSSAVKLPLKEDSQDIVLARRTGLSNDKNWWKVLSEAYRIIKKSEKSTFIFTVDKIFNKQLAEVKSDLKSANFEFVALKNFRRSKNSLLVSMIIAKPF